MVNDVTISGQNVEFAAEDSEAPTTSSQIASSKLSPGPTIEQVPEAIEEFDQLISMSVGNYAKLSNELGGVVAKQVSTSSK